MSPIVLKESSGENKLREERQQRRSIFEEEKKKPSVFDQEIQFKLNPRTAVKNAAFVFFILAVFLVGRWSVGNSTATDNSTGFSLLSFTTSLFGADTEDTTVPAELPSVAEPKPTAAAGATAAVVAETPPPDELAAEVPTEAVEVPEPVITAYSKVAVAITGLKHEFPNPEDHNYVRLTNFNYVIKNNEAGTIKPSYFILTVEGYNEEGDRKQITLTTEQKTVKMEKNQEGNIQIPHGFAVNSATAGSLENVRISIVLFDLDEKTMASFSKEFNLKN